MSVLHQKTPARKAEVRRRAEQPDSMYRCCRIIGCGQPARAGTADGLDRRHCRAHYDHHQRHGDPVKKSYTAAQLAPHRKDAQNWLRSRASDPGVLLAVAGVKRLYRQAGAVQEAFRLRGLTPRERAWAAWARLIRANVDPMKVLEAWLAINLAIAADPQPVRRREFRHVQAAKLVHRLASGSHKVWPPLTYPDPKNPFRTVSVPREMHVYPRSRGRVLRHIGEDLEEVANVLTTRMDREAAEPIPASAAAQTVTVGPNDPRPSPEDIAAALALVRRRQDTAARGEHA